MVGVQFLKEVAFESEISISLDIVAHLFMKQITCLIDLTIMLYYELQIQAWKKKKKKKNLQHLRFSVMLTSVYVNQLILTSQSCNIVGQSTHFKGWGFEILKNCKRVGVHIFPLKRVD